MKYLLVSGVAVLGLLAATPAPAATIVLNDLGGVGAGSDAYRGFSIAAEFWSRRLTNDVVINLDVGFKQLDPGVLGQAGSNSAVAPIELIKGQLASGGNSKIDAIAAANLPALKPGEYGWGALDVTTSGPKLPTGEGVDTGVRVLDIDFHVENKGKYNLYTNIYTLDMQGKATYKDIVNKLSEHTNIQGIRTRNT